MSLLGDLEASLPRELSEIPGSQGAERSNLCCVHSSCALLFQGWVRSYLPGAVLQQWLLYCVSSPWYGDRLDILVLLRKLSSLLDCFGVCVEIVLRDEV